MPSRRPMLRSIYRRRCSLKDRGSAAQVRASYTPQRVARRSSAQYPVLAFPPLVAEPVVVPGAMPVVVPGAIFILFCA